MQCALLFMCHALGHKEAGARLLGREGLEVCAVVSASSPQYRGVDEAQPPPVSSGGANERASHLSLTVCLSLAGLLRCIDKVKRFSLYNIKFAFTATHSSMSSSKFKAPPRFSPSTSEEDLQTRCWRVRLLNSREK